MDYQALTTATYDASAKEMAAYFAGIGSRIDDINRALRLAQQDDGSARAVEIGCGSGRDAVEIIKRVSWYQGFDPALGLLRIAQASLPKTTFLQADALSYTYPSNLDVIFAFASLLHVNQEDLRLVSAKVRESLRPGGIFYISLKEHLSYAEQLVEDRFGKRMFYLYSVPLVIECAGNSFEMVYENHYPIGKSDWFTIALKNIR